MSHTLLWKLFFIRWQLEAECSRFFLSFSFFKQTCSFKWERQHFSEWIAELGWFLFLFPKQKPIALKFWQSAVVICRWFQSNRVKHKSLWRGWVFSSSCINLHFDVVSSYSICVFDHSWKYSVSFSVRTYCTTNTTTTTTECTASIWSVLFMWPRTSWPFSDIPSYWHIGKKTFINLLVILKRFFEVYEFPLPFWVIVGVIEEATEKRGFKPWRTDRSRSGNQSWACCCVVCPAAVLRGPTSGLLVEEG